MPRSLPGRRSRGSRPGGSRDDRSPHSGPAKLRLAGLTRLLGASAIGTVMGLPPVLAAPASASASLTRAVGAAAAAGPPATLAITSVSPAFARPGQAITVSGWVRDSSSAAIRHATVSIALGHTGFLSRGLLQQFAAGTGSASQRMVPGAAAAVRRLPPGALRRWRVRIPAGQLQLGCFGVYPLSAQFAAADGTILATPDQTALPYWPARAAACPTAQPPVPDSVSWIWPLIDQPRQGPCPGLLDNGLAASLLPGGRLDGLLAAGLSYAARARLTWAIDPALLVSVRAMESRYQAGAGQGCGGGAGMPASRAARTWLAALITGTRAQPLFVTPYADVDIAALARSNLVGDLPLAFADGQRTAGSILGRSLGPGPAPKGAADSPLRSVAWPAAGVADSSVLTTLAAVDRITAVILDSQVMPPVQSLNYTPTAVSSTNAGVLARSGTGGGRGSSKMRVLLSDHELTQLLGSPAASSAAPGAVFAVRQLYLAQTAMIAAEAPNLARVIVVAPPRRWNPPARLAAGLLAASVSAPWLRPVSAASLLAGKPDQHGVTRQAPATVSPDELPGSLLRQVGRLDRRVRELTSIGVPGRAQAQRDQALERALFGVESSAWRGPAAERARARLRTTSQFVTSRLHALGLFGSRRYTLGGLGGSVRVSISNRLGYPVNVRLSVRVLQNAALVGSPGYVAVPGGLVRAVGRVTTVKIGVQAVNAGSTVIAVTLRAPNGAALPTAPLRVTVAATHFGRLALIIGAAALAIFMISSAARAIRRERPGTSAGAGAEPPPRGPGPGAAAARVPASRDAPPAPPAPPVPPERPGGTAAGAGRLARAQRPGRPD